MVMRENTRAKSWGRGTNSTDEPWLPYGDDKDEGQRRRLQIASTMTIPSCRNNGGRWPVWSLPVLDYAHVLAVRDGQGGGMLNWMVERAALADKGTTDDSVILLSDDPLCLENWLIVHSGAKSSPLELWNLHKQLTAAFTDVDTAEMSHHQQ